MARHCIERRPCGRCILLSHLDTVTILTLDSRRKNAHFYAGNGLHFGTMAWHLRRRLAVPVGIGTPIGLIASGVGAWLSSAFSGAVRIGVWAGATVIFALLLTRVVVRVLAVLGPLRDFPGRSPLSK